MADAATNGLMHPSLLERLADGRLHSGVSLAQELGVTRAAVWKGVQRLRAHGIRVESLPRRGYRLAAALELLDAALIRGELGAARARSLVSLELLFEVDSTNTHLLAHAPPRYGCAEACICELQSAGRGRRGRRWVAPFGGSIAMSLSWSFRDTVRDLPALSLAVGVAVSRALRRIGAQGIGLKWPNDIWLGQRKIGGVLIELRAEAGGPAFVVIGVGINVTLPDEARAEIESSGVRVAAVADACPILPSRNRLAGAILDELLGMLVQFESEGFAAFWPSWTALDVLQGRSAQVVIGERHVAGRARGVDRDGALQMEVQGRMQRFVSGEVSLRSVGGEA